MPTPVVNLLLMSAAAVIAAGSSAVAWRVWGRRAVDEQRPGVEGGRRPAAMVLLPFIAALPGIVLSLMIDTVVGVEPASKLEVPFWFRTWPVLGLPAVASVLALGFIMLGSPGAARVRTADGARLGAGVALAFLLIATGRVHLLEGQLLLLGGLVLWWCQTSQHERLEAESPGAARGGSGALWILLALTSAGAVGWFASRTLVESRLLPLVVALAVVYAASVLTLPMWATGHVRRASAVPTAIGTSTVLLLVSVLFGVGAIVIGRVAADAGRQVSRAHSESVIGVATEIAEALIARPYVGGLSPSAMEIGLAGCAAMLAWFIGVVYGDPPHGMGTGPSSRRMATVLVGIALLGGSLWMNLARMHTTGGMP